MAIVILVRNAKFTGLSFPFLKYIELELQLCKLKVQPRS